MVRLASRRTIATVASAGLMVLGACSSSKSSSSSVASPTTAASSATTAASAGAHTIGTATDPKLGTILVDSKGLTLYRNTKEKGSTIVCTAACATTWPPVTVAAGATPSGPSGLEGQFGTVTRPDGTVQVTYKNWPLYTYAGDSKPGDTAGQGIGGVWYAVTTTGPANGTGGGSTATTAAPSGPTTTSAYPGY